MPSRPLYSLCGVALLVGGALGAAGQLFHLPDFGAQLLVQLVRASVPNHWLLIAMLAMTPGLIAVYVRQPHKLGSVGLIGFLLLFCGLPLLEVAHSTNTLINVLFYLALAGFGVTLLMDQHGAPQAGLAR